MVVSFFIGCAMVMSPASGFLYTQTMGPVGAAQNGPSPKKGEACAESFLGIVGLGDASILAAAKNGGINTITTVDFSAFTVLGLYGKFCTVVRGS